jgi:hypothetical protein
MAGDSMKDWNKTLRLNAVASQLAPALYYARCQLYDADGPMWADVSPGMHRAYMDIAQRLLAELAPRNEPSNTNPPPRAPYLVAKPACIKCGTRDQSKHDAPYCGHLCRDAAKWQERTRI